MKDKWLARGTKLLQYTLAIISVESKNSKLEARARASGIMQNNRDNRLFDQSFQEIYAGEIYKLLDSPWEMNYSEIDETLTSSGFNSFGNTSEKMREAKNEAGLLLFTEIADWVKELAKSPDRKYSPLN